MTERTFAEVKFRVQRNGVTDRVNVDLGEELDVEGAESIEIIGVENLKLRSNKF